MQHGQKGGAAADGGSGARWQLRLLMLIEPMICGMAISAALRC